MRRKLWIDAHWTDASDGATYTVPNPATEESVGEAPDGTAADVDRAIGAARRAFDEGPWPRSARRERATAITRIADGMERRREELRRLVIAEAGAAYLTHDAQIDTPIRILRNFADLALAADLEMPLPNRALAGAVGPQMVSGVVCRQPVGVCALIPTWNFPLFVAVQKLGPALATGCTMVVKPSPWGPLINLLLAEIIAEADLPPGVVNVVTGQSPALGERLCADPRIDKISFTGSVATGRRIMAAAAPTLKRVHLELGGKSVGIYLDADDLATHAMTACGPVMFHAGQGCAMATRVLVRREVHDRFVQAMVGFVENAVTVGDPADPATLLGPVIRPERRAAIEEYIASGTAQGATLATGGGRPKHLPKGWFVEPTIFSDVANHLRIAQEEIFGPVVAVLPFRDEDEAVRLANDSPYGLGGAIYSADTTAAVALARRIRTGAVWINNGINMIDAPFGGFKQSGLGREGGRWGLDEYTELQHIAWRA